MTFDPGTPFASIPSAPMNTARNPFDPFGSPAPAPAPAPPGQHYVTNPGMVGMSPSSTYGSPVSGASVSSQQYPSQQQYGQNYGASQQQYPPQQQNPIYQQQPPIQQQSYAPNNPFDPSPTQAPSLATNQLVVAEQPSNPYAGLVAPAPAAPAQAIDYNSQSLVQASRQASPWGVTQPPAPAPAYYSASGAPPPAAPSQGVSQEYSQNPFEAPLAPAPAPPSGMNQQIVLSQHQAMSESQSQTNYQPSSATSEVRNKYSEEIARQAPPDASPLPKAELVRKKGFVLARISFRAIVTKRWKQSYWVQYGSHTMLWFRTQADFDDWLNNPYHTQARRNFLIKLAVNFVHDLYKPNVRGYQVTQTRSKPYRKKMVRQFKLERWMDYGPTIAAAFGSYEQKEIDALREAIVECMRNTPLDGGIRATGAVRQDHPQAQPSGGDYGQDSHNYGTQLQNGGANQGQNFSSNASVSSYTQHPSGGSVVNGHGQNFATAGRSVVSMNDLLGDHKAFDDMASYSGVSGVPAANNGLGALPTQQAYHGQTYPYQASQPSPQQAQYQQTQQQYQYQYGYQQNQASPYSRGQF